MKVLLRNIRSLYALWRQKTPLTNGQVKEAKAHCRKIGEAWRKLGSPPNIGISLSKLLSKTVCMGAAFATHAFHDMVSRMF